MRRSALSGDSSDAGNLTNMSELEIRDELKDQGVGIHRVTVRKNGVVIPPLLFFS